MGKIPLKSEWNELKSDWDKLKSERAEIGVAIPMGVAILVGILILTPVGRFVVFVSALPYNRWGINYYSLAVDGILLAGMALYISGRRSFLLRRSGEKLTAALLGILGLALIVESGAVGLFALILSTYGGEGGVIGILVLAFYALIFRFGLLLLSDSGKILEDKSHPPSRPKLDVAPTRDVKFWERLLLDDHFYARVKTCVTRILLSIPLLVLVYLTFFYNPLIPVTLPICVRVFPKSDTTNINLTVGLLENNTFTFSENLTLKPVVRAWTTQEYSSGQTIQLSAYKNGSAWGVVHNYTLPSVHFRCTELSHRTKGATHKLALESFYLECVITQPPRSPPTPICGTPRHWGPILNQVTFSFTGIERQPLTGFEAFFTLFFVVLCGYGSVFLVGIAWLSSQGKMLRDEILYQPPGQRLDVETQTKYPRDLFARYAEEYPHNPEGVLEWHINKKMKEGKTREKAIEELSKESK
ncbi:MAG: hypothetical protein JSW53_02630 [Candidatus Bathyarchaeota archaeon]|nr:MAG: hypothetical protein JSW53_02630 [Candidatus Bathyarchaeota archaeon]